MNIPSKVRIGSVDYMISRTDEIIIVNHQECFGDIDFNKKIIRIAQNIQDIQGEEITLLHEMLHGLVYERNFEYERCDDETITEEISRGLHQLIRDNPQVFNIVKSKS
ncbi:hypothetical protein SAMN02745134_00262 [Clostridium acidisoli DSM 12555]|uniref:Phage protein n=1 Tax=Clostridium acidisoli DSM 12555 TaxID=1121291 RepID=A0A1W1X0H6_9CLOT|nr:hypothetical protein [Clostridium acidisoli]SMC17218.1 hypothetical protein SAMN02745134_00262 [Clostridium acidisoli DSM 12555]